MTTNYKLSEGFIFSYNRHVKEHSSVNSIINDNTYAYNFVYYKQWLLIKWFLGSLGKETVLVLANAIHFKSGWAHKFEDAADEPFYTTPSKQITVKMMTLRKDLQYYRNEELKFAALELPYEV